MEAFLEFLRQPVELGSLKFTPLSLLFGLALIVVLGVAVGLLKRLLRDRVLPRAGLQRGVCVALATLIGYGVFLLGLLVILPIVIPGFNLNTLSVLVGAISFGIGFGLRNIADNFVSGLILLIERPIKVGDHIELDGVYGNVIEIKARATTVRTNDNIHIVVPNSEFISGRVTNVSHHDNRVRFRFPVGVHYRSDVHEVARALEAAGLACPDVLREPAPQAKFIEFGDSSLNFELWVWMETMFNRRQSLRSAVNFRIWEHLKAANIEVPYPQRDLYVKELPAALLERERRGEGDSGDRDNNNSSRADDAPRATA